MSKTDKRKVKLIFAEGFGNERFYPAKDCENAQNFALLRGRPSFTRIHLDLIKKLGFDLEDVTPPKPKVKL